MSPFSFLAAGLAFGLIASGSAAGAGPPPPPSIVHLALPPESEQRFPVVIPTEAEATVELDFPWPVTDWAGRGFTPDPEKYAGDFVIDAVRGSSRMFVTPVAAQAHRVLDVVLAPGGPATVSVPVEFMPAPPGYAWRKILFTAGGPSNGGADPEKRAAAADSDDRIRLSPVAPRARFREPTPETEIGLIRTMRLLLNQPEDLAHGIVGANPSLHLVRIGRPPRSFGDFTLSLRFALRDDATDSLGLCVDAANATGKRLIFDPRSWIVRAGDRAYPVQTADFSGEIEPGGTQTAFLVIGRGPDGAPTRLLPENEFMASVSLLGSVNPHPVRRFSLDASDER